jgi:hypothetical protein
MSPWRAAACLLALGMSGCSGSPPPLSPDQAAHLVTACDLISARHTAALEAVYPPMEAWPAPIATLHPEAVRVESEGVYLRVNSGFVSETGFFVPVPSFRGTLPGREADPSFELVAPRLYWYRAKG